MTYLEWKRHVSIFRFIRGKNVFEAIPEELEMLIYCKYKAGITEIIPITVTLIIAEEKFTVSNVIDCLTYAVAVQRNNEIATDAKPADSIALSITPTSTTIVKLNADNVADALISPVSPRLEAVPVTAAQMRDTDICGVITYKGAADNELCAVAAISNTASVSARAAVLFATQIVAIHSMSLAFRATLSSKIHSGATVNFEPISSIEPNVLLTEALRSQISTNFEKVGATEFTAKASSKITSVVVASTETVLINEILSIISTDLLGQISVNINAGLNDYLRLNFEADLGGILAVNIADRIIDDLVKSINANFFSQIGVTPESAAMYDFNIASELPELKVAATPDLLSAETLKAKDDAAISVSASLINVAKASVDDFAGKSVAELSGEAVEDSAYIEV